MITIFFVLHDDHYYLTRGLQDFQRSLPSFVFVNKLPFFGEAGDWQRTAEMAEAAGATVVIGEWHGEIEHRQAAGEHLLSLGYTHALLPDGDEIIEPRLLDTLLKIAEHDLADTVSVCWDTYWKTPEYVIRPREPFTPCYLANLKVAKPVAGHQYRGGRHLHLSEDYGIVHHLSWVGPEERIQRKLDSWAHAKEVLPGWRERVWKRWDSDKALTNIHPTHPGAYGFAERIEVPEILVPAYEKWKQLTGYQEPEPLAPVSPWPRVSVVIPVHGGEDDLATCLASLAPLHEEGLLHEVLVVDDASSDEKAIASVVESYPFAKLQRSETNQGFAVTCNAGAEIATGDLLLFLNSDTAVPRAGLLRLVESLATAGSLVAASGPYTNRAGHGQQVQATYTTLSTMPLFAEDFAQRDMEDEDSDMLVGFCLLVRTSAFREVGGFDTRFGIGTFEDNDICYALRRKGYQLRRASRSFIHHEGSKSLTRSVADVGQLLDTNQRRYEDKWKADLQSGYASHLSGMGGERIVFDPGRHPDIRLKAIRQRAKEADISLCMIVKNEERVLGDCLASAMPYFAQTIVCDTGSDDRTVEIAKKAGATVTSFPWTSSFSEARNASLVPATGKWIFWLDADDTMEPAAGEAILMAALNAPPEVVAFVVPVQFLDENGLPGATRVDHVKLFRNLPGVAFEGRIHEQILPSLRSVAGPDAQIARAPQQAVVLHSGYDTSVEGQAKKRERDSKLLELDLKERPGHPFVLFNLGMTDHYCGEHEGAIKWLGECIEASQPVESHVRKAYALLAVSQRELERREEALETLTTGLTAVGDDPELHFQAGFLLAAMGRFAESRTHYEKTVATDISGHFSSVDMAILGYKTFHNLASVCQALGDYDAAVGWWRRSLADASHFSPSAFDWFDAAVAKGDFPGAREALGAVEKAEGLSENWTRMGVRLAEAENGTNGGANFLENLVSQQPQALSARLQLARQLLESGRENEAQPHLVQLASSGVSEAAFFLGVLHTRQGDLNGALHWMERALALNPSHIQTLEQVENLKKALGKAR